MDPNNLTAKQVVYGVVGALIMAGGWFVFGTVIVPAMPMQALSFSPAPKVEQASIAPKIPSPLLVQVPQKPDAKAEQIRFAEARKRLSIERPKTEAAIMEILGEPSYVIQDFQGVGDLVHWYYETQNVGRNVIQCVVHPNGKISMLSY